MSQTNHWPNSVWNKTAIQSPEPSTLSLVIIYILEYSQEFKLVKMISSDLNDDEVLKTLLFTVFQLSTFLVRPSSDSIIRPSAESLTFYGISFVNDLSVFLLTSDEKMICRFFNLKGKTFG